MLTRKKILKAINDPRVTMHRGDGYWYFNFEDGPIWDTKSVYVYRLNAMTLAQWVSDVKAFIEEVEEEHYAC